MNKADLVVDLNKVYHTYGDPNLKDYGISGVEGLTNGDEASKDKLDVEMTKDTALKDNNTHTNNAGDYTWTGSVSGIEGIENNYNITVNNGESVVNKAKLDIIIDNTTIEKVNIQIIMVNLGMIVVQIILQMVILRILYLVVIGIGA